jgi:hypothetical protein
MWSAAQLHRKPNRAHYDADTVHAIMDEALYCTVSFIAKGVPVTIPINFVRIDDTVIIHGKSNAGFARGILSGSPVCLTFTLVRSTGASRLCGGGATTRVLCARRCRRSTSWCWRGLRSTTR